MDYLTLFCWHLWNFLIPGMVFDNFQRFERVCLPCCHTRAPKSMLQIDIFVDFSVPKFISNQPSWTIWPLFCGCHWYSLTFGIGFDHLERFERVDLSCCHFRGLQNMPQMDIFVSLERTLDQFPTGHHELSDPFQRMPLIFPDTWHSFWSFWEIWKGLPVLLYL